MKVFSPAGKHFSFNFNDGSCFEKATGVCLFDAENEFIEKNKNLPGKNIASRCFKIYELMKEGKLWPPVLVEHSCGHFSSGDGQHRLCIAGKNQMTIKVDYVNDKNGKCDWCENPDEKTNIYSLKQV